jgi:hypothetical protein
MVWKTKGNRIRFSAEAKDFSPFHTFGPAVGPTQPPEPRSLPHAKIWREVKLTTDLHLMLK